MATDLPAMRVVLDKLDLDIDNDKTCPDEKSQEQFWQHITHENQVEDLRHPRGVKQYYNWESLKKAMGYTLRDKKKKQYSSDGGTETKAQAAMNLFFAIGSDMLKDEFLADIDAAARAKAAGTYVHATSKKKRPEKSNKASNVVLKIRNDRQTPATSDDKMDEEEQMCHHHPRSDSMEPNYEPVEQQTKSKKRKVDDTTTHEASRAQKKPKTPLPPAQKTPEFSPAALPPLPPKNNHASRTPQDHPPLGSISKSEALSDIESISTLINDLLSRGASNTIAQLTHTKIVKFLFEEIFSCKLAARSPFLGIVSQPCLSRAVESTNRIRILDADGIARELALAQLRDAEFISQLENRPVCVTGSYMGMIEMNLPTHEERLGREICGRAWVLKGKMEVSREKFMVVRSEGEGMGDVLEVRKEEGILDEEDEEDLGRWRSGQ